MSILHSSQMPQMMPYHIKEPNFVVRRVADLEICRRLKKRSILDVCEHFSDKQSFEDAPLSHQILLSEGISCGSWSQALKAEHTKTYVSISTTSQMPQMIPYHIKEPNLLLEGIRYNAQRISRRWAVLKRTAH